MRLPRFFTAKAKPVQPDMQIQSRTGEAKWAPRIRGDRVKGNRFDRRVLAHRIDSISLLDLDRVRFFPTCIDAIRQKVAPVARVNWHFSSTDTVMADLASQELGRIMPQMVRQLYKGGIEFGWQIINPQFLPKFNVTVSSGQAAGAGVPTHTFPFIYTISQFASFAPTDTEILIDSASGAFVGVRQYIGSPAQMDISADKLVIYTHNREYDYLHGVPDTKGAIPWVEIAESIVDSMAIHADVFAVPAIKISYPSGSSRVGTIDTPNQTIALDMGAAIRSGQIVAVPSDMHDQGGRKWDCEAILGPSTSDNYPEKIGLCNNEIRKALGVPEFASSESPDSGTYNLGESVITLFLANIEADLDAVRDCIQRVVDLWRIVNFGYDSAPLRVFAEPVDLQVTKALLSAVVQALGSGQPIQDSEGNSIFPDWGKILQDKGVATVTVKAKDMANQLYAGAMSQLNAAQGGQGQNPQGPPDEPESVDSAFDKAMAPADPKLSTRAAIRLAERAIDSLDYPPSLRAFYRKLLAEATPEQFDLADFDEQQHPRNADGTFKTKAQIEAEAAGTKTMPHDEFAANHTPVQDKGWTRGRLPSIVEHDGDLYVPTKNPDGTVSLRPAHASEVMPSLAKKMLERANPAFTAARDRTNRYTSGETPAAAVNFGKEINQHLAPISWDNAIDHLNELGANATPEEQLNHLKQYGVSPAIAGRAIAVFRQRQAAAAPNMEGVTALQSAEGFPFYEARVDPKSIHVYPGMQYKKSEVTDDENQVGDKLKDVEKYDQATAGPLTVWQANDGNLYVMNGHHRRELAIRTGESSVPIKVFREADGIDFDGARGMGALQNVRDGKGTALDAAFAMRDLGYSVDKLKKAGVALARGVGRDAVSLMKLDPESLESVKQNVIPQTVAAGIADANLPLNRQRVAIRAAASAGLNSRQEGEDIGRRIASAQLQTVGGPDLFGDTQEDVAWGEQAKIGTAVANALGRNAKLFRALTKGTAAGSTVIDEAAQLAAADQHSLAQQAIGTSPEIQAAIESESMAYKANPTRKQFDDSVAKVLEVAAAAGAARAQDLGVAPKGDDSDKAGKPIDSQLGDQPRTEVGSNPMYDHLIEQKEKRESAIDAYVKFANALSTADDPAAASRMSGSRLDQLERAAIAAGATDDDFREAFSKAKLEGAIRDMGSMMGGQAATTSGGLVGDDGRQPKTPLGQEINSIVQGEVAKAKEARDLELQPKEAPSVDHTRVSELSNIAQRFAVQFGNAGDTRKQAVDHLMGQWNATRPEAEAAVAKAGIGASKFRSAGQGALMSTASIDGQGEMFDADGNADPYTPAASAPMSENEKNYRRHTLEVAQNGSLQKGHPQNLDAYLISATEEFARLGNDHPMAGAIKDRVDALFRAKLNLQSRFPTTPNDLQDQRMKRQAAYHEDNYSDADKGL